MLLNLGDKRTAFVALDFYSLIDSGQHSSGKMHIDNRAVDGREPTQSPCGTGILWIGHHAPAYWNLFPLAISALTYLKSRRQGRRAKGDLRSFMVLRITRTLGVEHLPGMARYHQVLVSRDDPCRNLGSRPRNARAAGFIGLVVE